MHPFLDKARSLAGEALAMFSGEDERCAHQHGGNFCPSCGKQLEAKPLDWDTLLEDFNAVWLRRGFRNTLVGLFVRPHVHITTYLRSDRNFLLRPVLYLSTTALFFVWVLSMTGGLAACEPGTESACQILEQYPVLVQLFQALLLAYLTKQLIARNAQWSLGDLVVVMVYLLSQSFLITATFNLANWSAGSPVPQWVAAVIRSTYHYVALALFLDYRSIRDFLRLLGVLLLSMFCSMLIFVGVFSLAIAMAGASG